MKPKHINIRIEQCLALAKASGCPRRKLGALLVDPERNVILADGYNGGPRGAEGSLCEGHWCSRNGFNAEEMDIVEAWRHNYERIGGPTTVQVIQVKTKDGLVLKTFDVSPLEKLLEETELEAMDFSEAKPNGGPLDELAGVVVPAKTIPSTKQRAEAWAANMMEKHPPIQSGTRMERGCHHAEMNVVCNAAANGIKCKGAWMIVLAEPCMMCAKLIHHSGIAKVIVVDGGYMGGKDGVDYLRNNGVEVQEVEGPQDPRFSE
jgi:deoxycytidylate deaminase